MNITQILSFTNTHFFIGIDHLKNRKVTIRMGGIELISFSINPSPLVLLAYLRKHYPDGIYHKPVSAYYGRCVSFGTTSVAKLCGGIDTT